MYFAAVLNNSLNVLIDDVGVDVRAALQQLSGLSTGIYSTYMYAVASTLWTSMLCVLYIELLTVPLYLVLPLLSLPLPPSSPPPSPPSGITMTAAILMNVMNTTSELQFRSDTLSMTLSNIASNVAVLATNCTGVVPQCSQIPDPAIFEAGADYNNVSQHNVTYQ